MGDKTRTSLLPYGGAVVFTGLAVLLRWLLDPWLGDALPLATLYAAVALAVWFGGYRPALLAAVLGLFVCYWLFVEPRGAWGVGSARTLMGLCAYLLVCSIIIGFGEARHAARRRTEAEVGITLDLAERERAKDEILRLNLELRRRADELQAILDILPIGVAIAHDPQCRRITHNPYMSELLNVPAWANASLTAPENERPTTFTNYRNGIEVPTSELPMQVASTGVEVRDLELDLVCQGRDPRTMLYHARPLFDEHGKVRGSVGVCLDITARKQAEEALRQGEQRFARFMHQLPGLAWIKDLQGRYVYANDAAVKAFRCTRDGLYGRTDDEVFPPETAAQFKQNDRAALASEAGVQVIETLEHEDGIVHYSVVSKFPILGPQGTPALVGGMAIDITDRLLAEKVLAESEERFRQLAENINEVFWMTDPQTTRLLYISPAYERVWGRTCQSLHDNPRSFLDAVHPEDRERVQRDVLERQSRGEQIDKEYRVVRPDGSIRWVRDRAFPVGDAAGQFYRLVGIIDDFTERKYAEDALKEANRRKDEFLATLAHELRNPLAPIRNAVELMRRAQGDAGLLEKARSIIERQVVQMVRLVDDLLDISRITKGKLQLRQERVELAAVVRSAIEAVRPLIDAQAQELTITLPPEPVLLDADPTRLAQVISNLLNNAAKFTDRGGHIWLAAQRQGGQVAVSVRDTGIGIAADYLPHIFEMFSQATPALERSQGGLGIGLALVRGLVELSGGSVEAQSAGPGKGSEFTLRLPIVDATVPARPETRADGEKSCVGPKCRILVAEDLRDSADSLALLLRLAGHDILVARDGLEAVQAAATFRPDVVLLDIGMPRMNGYEAARQIRQQPWGKGVALVALTGWGQEEDKRRALEAGFDCHLTKPVEAAALEKLLARISPVPPG
jgi:PAS domain S-box-containing protein